MRKVKILVTETNERTKEAPPIPISTPKSDAWAGGGLWDSIFHFPSAATHGHGLPPPELRAPYLYMNKGNQAAAIPYPNCPVRAAAAVI